MSLSYFFFFPPLLGKNKEQISPSEELHAKICSQYVKDPLEIAYGNHASYPSKVPDCVYHK